MFVCLGFGHFILFVCFFPWPRSSKGPRMRRQFFKNVDFSVTYPLRGCTSLLEIVFCRTVLDVCLSWIWSFYFICLFFSLAAKLKRSANGVSIL